MAREKLDALMSSVASSMARANKILTESNDTDVHYVVTELEMSVPYSDVQLEKDEVLVDLDTETADTVSERFVRFKVRPFPDIRQTAQRPQPGTKPTVPELKQKTLDESLMALHTVGVPMDRVVIAFDPKADVPEGVISQYQVRTVPGTGEIDEIVLTVAGKPPSVKETPAKDKEENEVSDSDKPSASGRRRSRKTPPDED